MPHIIDLKNNSNNDQGSILKPKKKKPKKSKKGVEEIEWTAPEFTKYKRTKGWFYGLVLASLVIITIAVIFNNLLWVILTVLAAFSVYIYSTKEPRKIKFTINGRGITIDQKTYRFENLRSFWIFYEPPEIKELSLRSKKAMLPYVKIPLGSQNPVKIRKFLLKFIPERKHTESIIDNWARKAKF